MHLITKIVSGGQTGVDRGALDAALKVGFACGGWCPDGRKAEDGVIPKTYPLQVLEGAGYSGRTLRNVIDSDGTVILHFGPLTGDTHLTAPRCRKEGRPYLLIDADRHTREESARLIAQFAADNRISVLNVAGPRESQAPRAYAFAFDVVTRLLMDHQGVQAVAEADLG